MAQPSNQILSKIELETTVKLMRSLNFYQILKVSPIAGEEEIREAFHREALAFHPDRYSDLGDPELIELVKKAYAKVVDAYRTLSSREKRLEYDQSLNPKADPLDEESTVDENAITSVKKRPTWASGGPGDKFFKMAEKAHHSGDHKSALVNIKIAMGSDPNNSQYKSLKLRIEAALQKAK